MPEDGRSHFGAVAVAFHDEDVTPQPVDTALSYLLDATPPRNAEELATLYADRLREAVQAWREGSTTPSQAAFLDWFVRQGFLPGDVGASDRLSALVAEYRRLEAEVPIFRRAPSVLDEVGPGPAAARARRP